MNTIQNKPLIPLSGGRWARIGLSVLLTSLLTVGAQAQTASEGIADPPRDTNKELRTRTWSVYAQGGLSWATGVWYQNLDAKKSYKQSPAVGGGFDFTIRPWVRIGADYIWSRYRREQRFDKLDTQASPAKSYGNYVMNTHNVKVGAQFNFMEFWPNRKPQWLNIWMGTGFGGTFARGNEYGIWIGNTISENGNTTAFFGDMNISNDATVTITGKVATVNRREKFNKLFIPATLHIEADVSRQFTLGLKGEVDWLLNREAALRQQAEQQNSDLQRQLNDCRNSKRAVAEAPEHYVQFAHNSSYMSREETDRLRSFARSMKGEKLAILAEASTPGTPEYNQTISERRLERVVKVLLKEGFAPEDLHPQTAIGAQNGKKNFEGRRVTIKVKR